MHQIYSRLLQQNATPTGSSETSLKYNDEAHKEHNVHGNGENNPCPTMARSQLSCSRKYSALFIATYIFTLHCDTGATSSEVHYITNNRIQRDGSGIRQLFFIGHLFGGRGRKSAGAFWIRYSIALISGMISPCCEYTSAEKSCVKVG